MLDQEPTTVTRSLQDFFKFQGVGSASGVHLNDSSLGEREQRQQHWAVGQGTMGNDSISRRQGWSIAHRCVGAIARYRIVAVTESNLMRTLTYSLIGSAWVICTLLAATNPVHAFGCRCSRTRDTNAQMQGFYYICCNADGMCQYAQIPPPGCTLGGW